jgi:hypothetical protein
VASQINSPKVIHQVFETEVVIVNLETGNYYSVTGSGIAIWEQLDAGVAWAQMVTQFPNGDDSRQVRAFLDELEREQLILPDDGHTAATSPAAVPQPFVPPRLEKFTDMREMLLIDPIHELDEGGWPKPLPPNQT